jgi:hypothetical protein
MNKQAVIIISIALLIGATASFSQEITEQVGNQVQQLTDTQQKPATQNREQGYRIGSAHEHALFYVVINNTELSFLENRYQLATGYVHLENNNSHIVHKHAKGVTWNAFLQTVDTDINTTENGYCGSIKNQSYCGEGAVSLNGQLNGSLDKEISQGDKLVIVLQENWKKVLEEYNSKQLPRAYKPEGRRGRRL